MEKGKGFVRDGLVVLVVAHHPPASVRRQNFRGQEMLASERGFAGPAGANQDDERQVWYLDLHYLSFSEYLKTGDVSFIYVNHVGAVKYTQVVPSATIVARPDEPNIRLPLTSPFERPVNDQGISDF
jgi:hypothetical protein